MIKVMGVRCFENFLDLSVMISGQHLSIHTGIYKYLVYFHGNMLIETRQLKEIGTFPYYTDWGILFGIQNVKRCMSHILSRVRKDTISP